VGVNLKAIVTDAPHGGVWLREINEPVEHGDVLVQTVYTGVCGTDRGIVSGSLEFARKQEGFDYLVLGHECVGRVVESRNSSLKEGDFVVPVATMPGGCMNCHIGRPDYCSDGDFRAAGVYRKNGYMRSYFREDSDHLIRVPDPSLSLIAVLTEPLKNVMKVVDLLSLLGYRCITTAPGSTYSGKRALIIGTGPEALLFSRVFCDMGFHVIAVNRHDIGEKHRKLIEKSGAFFVDYSRDKLDGMEFDVAVDTSGDPSAVVYCIRKMARNGILFLFGTNGRAPAYGITGTDIDRVVEYNIAIAGSVDGGRVHYEKALRKLHEWYMQDRDSVRSLITAIRKPEDLDVFRFKEEGEIKSVIEW
jgi:glucose/galactose 1-dehydrogenase (NADP+)